MKKLDTVWALGVLTLAGVAYASCAYASNCDDQREFERIRSLPKNTGIEIANRNVAIQECLGELYTLLKEQQSDFEDREVNVDTYMVNNIMRDQIYRTQDYISLYHRL
jgi:hypothetical protein